MADQKKWFKVWGSILVDPTMSGLTLSDMGRWVRLGAYISTSGKNGKLVVTYPSPMFLLAMEVESLADAKMALRRLPNVTVIDWPITTQSHGESGQFQRSKVTVENDNDGFTVIMRNWFKYQVDSTSYERVKRSRRKKRGEEKRREESEKPFLSTPEIPKWT